jgi:putative RNA 2'-phosphotransferase
MSESREIASRSKYVSWILRHRPPGDGVSLDEAGWVSVDALLQLAGMSRLELEAMASNDRKGRLQLVGDRVRACQGHSAKTGVTCEALEESWSNYGEESPIWHGTRLAAIEQIALEGLLPGDRTHVHCASAPDSIVGKRGDSHLLLKISPARVRAAGLGIFVAPNGVILVRNVPPSAIIGVVALTKEARKREDVLKSLFVK